MGEIMSETITMDKEKINKMIEYLNSIGLSTSITTQRDIWHIYIPSEIRKILKSLGFDRGNLVKWYIEKIEGDVAEIKIKIFRNVKASRTRLA